MMASDLFQFLLPRASLQYYHGRGIRVLYFFAGITMLVLGPNYWQGSLYAVPYWVFPFVLLLTGFFLQPGRLLTSYFSAGVSLLGCIGMLAVAFYDSSDVNGLLNFLSAVVGVLLFCAAFLNLLNIYNYAEGKIDINRILEEDGELLDAEASLEPKDVLTERMRKLRMKEASREKHLAGD